jgi:thiol-disulfide isomerase/thioredoxin
MRKQVFFLVGLILSIANELDAQTATITFQTDSDISVSIYTPIDGAFNFKIISDKLELKPHISIDYKVPISDFSFIKCTYSDGSQQNILLLENDKLIVDYSQNGIVWKGMNAEGMVYYNQKFNPMLIAYNLDSIFDKNVLENKQIANIPNALKQDIITGMSKDIHQLCLNGKITPQFSQIIEKDILYFIYDMTIRRVRKALTSKDISVSQEDSVFIKQFMDSIYMVLPPSDTDIMKYNSSSNYVSRYYDAMFANLNAETKQDLKHEYGDIFGPYISYLLAPDVIRSDALGNALITELMYDFGDLFGKLDKNKMLQYLTGHYPQSQYLPILKQMMAEKQKEKNFQQNKQTDSIIILEQTVSALKDLSSIEFLKGNFLFVDLWATWCLPCLIEFRHNEELHQLLAQYTHLVPIYISIDNDKLDTSWRNGVQKHNLNGYNLRASSDLYSNIVQIINQGKELTIPRYILLDPTGNVIDDNLPRPSSMDKLKDTLDRLVK